MRLGTTAEELQDIERTVEEEVSSYIGAMPFTVVSLVVV